LPRSNREGRRFSPPVRREKKKRKEIAACQKGEKGGKKSLSFLGGVAIRLFTKKRKGQVLKLKRSGLCLASGGIKGETTFSRNIREGGDLSTQVRRKKEKKRDSTSFCGGVLKKGKNFTATRERKEKKRQPGRREAAQNTSRTAHLRTSRSEKGKAPASRIQQKRKRPLDCSARVD